MIIRKAFLANQWYTADPERLKEELDMHFMNEKFGPGKKIACLGVLGCREPRQAN